MTTKLKHIDDLHFEHQLWLCEVKFFADELKIYQSRLEEVAAKNNKTDVLKQVEHFQNLFIIQKEKMKGIKNLLKKHEAWLNSYSIKNPVAVDHKLFPDHTMMRDQVETFKKLYFEMKKEFNSFLSVQM